MRQKLVQENAVLNIEGHYHIDIMPLTKGPHHHFFGFHDLFISSHDNRFALALQVPRIDSPPDIDDVANVGVVDLNELCFVPVSHTKAFNFPQGARQQWLGLTSNFSVNVRDGVGFASDIYDAESGKKVGHLDQAVYAIDDIGRFAYTVDFRRLNRLGGYGYPGASDPHANEPAPGASGIFRIDISSNSSDLLVSIDQVASLGENSVPDAHHYLTHLLLSPNGHRIAFLHRFRLPDGGDHSRLMSVDVDGSGLSCLAEGFLSHFDWADNNSILIWGRPGRSLSLFRQHSLLKNAIGRRLSKVLKEAVRSTLHRNRALRKSFLLVEDHANAHPVRFAEEQMNLDGHPMFNKADRRWLISDTYPDGDGFRDLYLMDVVARDRINVGRFPVMIDRAGDDAVLKASRLLKEELDVDFDCRRFAFSRSGLHCDLHPRWFRDNRKVAIDLLKDGSRQIYFLDLGDIMDAVG